MTQPVGALSHRHRAAVLAVWALLLALAAAVIWRTPFAADLSAFLPAKPDARQRVLIEQLQSGVAARTLFIGIDGGSAEQRAAASRSLATALRASGRFEQVQNGEGDGFAAVGTWLFEHRYQLSPAVDAAHFTPGGLREAIDETLSLLGTPAGNAIKPLLERDPTGETQRIGESLIPSNAPRSDQGVWVSRQGARAVLLANVAAAGADLDGQAAALATARESFARAAAPGLVLRLSGAPVFSVDSRAQIEREAKMLAIAGTLLMSGLLWLAFASLPALFVALLPVLTGVLAGIATVGLVFGSVHGVTLGFGSTLIGEAVDYGIYYLIQAHRPAAAAGAGEAGWRDWLRHSWPTVRLGLLTSVCGFAALAFSGFPGLAQLGVFSTAGLVAAALATRFVLPVLMPDGTPGQGMRKLLGRVAAAGLRVLPRWRRSLLALGVVAAAGLLWQRGELWRADLMSLSPISKDALALDASLRADLSASDEGALVVVQGTDIETTLQRAEAVGLQLDRLVDSGAVASYSSVTRWLPSQATQRRRLASLPEAAALRAALVQATAGGPLPARRLEPFIAEVQAARALPPITAAALKGSALAPLVEALLLQRKDGSWAALLPVQGSGSFNPAALRPALEAAAGVQLLEIKPELDRLYSRYLGEAQAQTLLGALGVVAAIGLWLRSWRRLLAVCQPLVLAVVLTLGGLAALQVPLGILHLVGLLLVVAVGSNYALFFDMLQAQRDGGEDIDSAAGRDTLASLLLANLTTVLSFGLIALSSIPALSAIGRVVAPGALLALLLAAAFARPAPGRAVANAAAQPGRTGSL
jgi:predicted exporter